MISIININNGIKKPTHRYQNCKTNQILVFGRYLKAREYLYAWVVIWVNTILDHIDTEAILLKYESSCIVYRPEWYQKQKYHQILIPYWNQKIWNPHYRYPKWYWKIIKMILDQQWCIPTKCERTKSRIQMHVKINP